MSRIKNTSEIETYDDPAKSGIRIDSHWCYAEKVVIRINGEERTVVGSELKLAIDNCMNVEA
jgi:hypothetical protein